MICDKYTLTSENFSGELVLEYNLQGVLVSFANNAELSSEQLNYLSTHFPLTVDAANELLRLSVTLRATVVPAQLTFEAFWDAYDHKAYSNKKLSVRIWDRLTYSDKIAVMTDIPRYENRLIKQPGVAKKYAETYLRSEVWR